MIRLAPILAIAHRDLRCELAARQRGWILIGITGLLLLPLATIPTSTLESEQDQFIVAGNVPEAVKQVPNIKVVDGPAHMGLVPEGDTLIAVGQPPPPRLRKALDASGPALEWRDVSPERQFPKRSILFALVSASVLTGALSESISGERSQRTLQALLTAAVTRIELIGGKWLAWAGFGAFSAMLAAFVSLMCNTTDWGWWLLPLPVVPATTVALGLYMVRHATDRVSGATISLRVLPAVLSVLAILAWFLGDVHPVLGACVPLGGALIATGQVWSGPLPAIVASITAAAAAGMLLLRTAKQLEQKPESQFTHNVLKTWVVELLLGLVLWWMPLLGALIWANAGNAPLTAYLSVRAGLLAATGMAGLAALILYFQPNVIGPDPVRRPASNKWLIWCAAVAALLLSGWLPTWPGLNDGLWLEAYRRMNTALSPTSVWPWAGWLLIPIQELYFRGRLVRRLGGPGAVILFTVIATPLNPLLGLAMGTVLLISNQQGRFHILPSVWIRILALGLLSLPLFH